jgi:(2Fe-2S) ferredoxin
MSKSELSGTDTGTTAGYDLHIFVCTNKREASTRPSCGNMNSEALRAQLKTWLGQRVKNDPKAQALRVRVNASGCLDYCEQGVAVAIYPLGELQLHVQMNVPDSIEALKSKIEAEVQRLILSRQSDSE